MQQISIITVNYNHIEGLKKTVESVKSQLYPAIEYIVIDGGSKDGSKTFLEEQQNSFAYWISEKDNGIYDGMNKGLLHATGDYVLFLNSGDYLKDSRALVKVMRSINEKTDLIICRQAFINQQGHQSKSPILRRKHIRPGFFLSSTFPHQATLIKRSLFDSYGYYDLRFKVSADWAFWVKAILEYKCSYTLVNYCLSVMEQGGISNDISKCHADMEIFLNECMAKHLISWEDLFEQAMRSRALDFCEVHAWTRLLNKVSIWIGKYC